MPELEKPKTNGEEQAAAGQDNHERGTPKPVGKVYDCFHDLIHKNPSFVFLHYTAEVVFSVFY